MVKASHLGEENNGTVRRLLAEMKQRFPRGSEQLILEVIYENHGNYNGIMHELTQRCGSPILPETLNPAMPSGTNPLYPPYTRSVSDTTGFPSNGIAQPLRPFNMEMSDQNLLQHIRRQQESCKRLEEKVLNLRKETKRLQMEIHREEDELDTRSKVQKNPTEKDIEKHREEIAILRKEVLEANNRLERARGEVNIGSASVVSVPTPPPGHIDPQSPQQILHTSPLPVHPVSSARFPLVARFPVHSGTQISGQQATSPITTPSDSEETQASSGTWSCITCTYDNHPDLQECEMCGTPRYT